MKKLFALLGFLAIMGGCHPVPTLAAENTPNKIEILKAMPDGAYCQNMVEFFKSGADAGAAGYPRLIKQMPIEYREYLEHHVPLPKTAMWSMMWDQLSSKEQDFMREEVFKGWDKVQEMRETGIEIPETYVDQVTQAYFNDCVRIRTKESIEKALPKTIFKTSTQNESFAKLTQEECDILLFDIQIIVRAKYEEMPQEKLTAFAMDDSLALGEPRLLRILRQIKEAYAWGGSMEKWVEKETKGCDKPL